MSERISGVILSLSALHTRHGWGIGDIADIAPTAEWLAAHDHRLLQLLPVHEVPPGEQSPYSALSAFAIDPIYVALGSLEEALEAASDESGAIRAVRGSPRVLFDIVRALKMRVLHRAFETWRTQARESERRAHEDFRAEESYWLDEYCLYRALKKAHGLAGWEHWPAGDRDRTRLAAARASLADEVAFLAWVQWVAHRQWQGMRARLRAIGVSLKGDLPFMVNRDSADVWSSRQHFRLDVSVGAPPDAFSEEGQDWGLPAFDWATMARDGFGFFARRAARAAELFDVARVDHVIGLYRTWVRGVGAPAEPGKKLAPGTFYPPGDGTREQIALGEKVLRAMQRDDLLVCAEDLGVIPDWARASMKGVGVPGYRVFRWEREWNEKGQPYRDPAGYPELSFACSGTHDTETLAEWFDLITTGERAALAHLPTAKARGVDFGGPYDARVRHALLEALYSAGSRWTIVPLQDLLGWRDRINVPATVGPDNWTWRLPRPLEELRTDPDVASAMAEARELARRRARGDLR